MSFAYCDRQRILHSLTTTMSLPRALRRTASISQKTLELRPSLTCLPRTSRRSLSNEAHSTSTNDVRNNRPKQTSETTHFGFRTVDTSDKESLVRNVFSSVASKYDLMNDAMSFGVHRLWKDQYISTLAPGSSGPIKCIDVAGGTGDIALRILDYARERHYDRETSVDVVDINPKMLKSGQKRFKQTMYYNSTCQRLF